MHFATSTGGIDKRNAHNVALVGYIVQKMIQTFFNGNRSINPNEDLALGVEDSWWSDDEGHRAQHSHSHEERAQIRNVS